MDPAGLLVVVRDLGERRRLEAERRRAEAAAHRLDTLNRVGRLLAAEPDREALLQAVVDAGVALTGAAFGAFFHNAVDERGESYVLYVLSGVPREAFAGFPMPRATDIFGPTFRGEPPVRLADVRADPRYGRNPPHAGMPPGHLPVVSYLAVSVVSRSGEVLGGLFFGHPEPGVFDQDAEDLAVGLAAHAAVALDNAALLRRARAGEARFRRLLEANVAGVVLGDAGGGLRYANDAYLRIVGHSRADLEAGRVDWAAITPPEWAAADARAVAEARERGASAPYEKEYVAPDGSRVPVLVVVARVEEAGEEQLVGTVLDLRERRRLEALRRDFLAMVTHDLRTPLTAVRGYAQLLQRRGEYRAEAVAGILDQADRMQALIGDLTDVVRLEAGRLELRRGPIDLAALAEREAAAARDQAPGRPIRVEAPGGPVVGPWDGDRLGQVLQNLLANALKHAPAGAVVVRVGVAGGVARLSVRDEGEGIAPEHLPRLFDRFYRAGDGGAGGLGLGLYITRMLVEAHGGRVAVESVPGAGSTFTVELPIA